MEEFVNESLDSALDTDDIEEEIEEEVDKVLSEVAGETAAQLPATRKERLRPQADTSKAKEPVRVFIGLFFKKIKKMY